MTRIEGTNSPEATPPNENQRSPGTVANSISEIAGITQEPHQVSTLIGNSLSEKIWSIGNPNPEITLPLPKQL